MKISTDILLDLEGFAAYLREIGDAEQTITTYLQHLKAYDKWYRMSFAERCELMDCAFSFFNTLR